MCVFFCVSVSGVCLCCSKDCSANIWAVFLGGRFVVGLCLDTVTWSDTDRNLHLLLFFFPAADPGWVRPCQILRGCQQTRYRELAEAHPVCPHGHTTQLDSVPDRWSGMWRHNWNNTKKQTNKTCGGFGFDFWQKAPKLLQVPAF